MSTPEHPSAPASPPARTDATVGQRVGAILLDTVIVLLPLYVVAGLLFGESRASGGSASVSLSGWPFVITTVIAFGYFFALELTMGPTVGKKIVGIRVVSDRDAELTTGQALVRTVLRLVDGFAFYLVGFITALASDKNQRVGDMAASTRVVRAR